MANHSTSVRKKGHIQPSTRNPHILLGRFLVGAIAAHTEYERRNWAIQIQAWIESLVLFQELELAQLLAESKRLVVSSWSRESA